MRLSTIVETSLAVSETRSRLEKIERLSETVRALAPDEIATGVSYLAGNLPQGRIGIGYATLQKASVAPAETPSLTLADVHSAFDAAAATSGSGSAAARLYILAGLLGRAGLDEQQFLVRLVMGELRQGALEGVMADAIAGAACLPASEVRRALMLAGGDLASVAEAALLRGAPGLQDFRLQVLEPVKSMLAQPADGLADALARLGTVGLEYKLDGARVQVHKQGNDVRIFTRRLHDVTAAVPEIVETARALDADTLILDGETIALRDDGTPYPFQSTMRRFGRKLELDRLRGELPLRVFFFDCLHFDGDDLIDRVSERRFDALEQALPPALLMPRIVTGKEPEARKFLEQALSAGHEGVMAKALDAAYEAGGRGRSWLKVKQTHTLDLVVLGAEWGSGRRRGWLSNLHLGTRDPSSGEYVMLGKTFKGMTDEVLAWQTEKLQDLEVARDRHTVYVKPELVVEIAFDNVQTSPQYPGGVALRFARLRQYRPDKSAEEADTLDAVRAIHGR